MTVVGEYCDHAVSGTSDKRPEFMRMIRDSARATWQRVLVYKVDRFARNRYDSAMYKARLKRNGVKVLSVMEPIPDGPEGILLESVLEGSAEYYSANLSQNILRGMHDNALACRVNNGHLPLGYVKGPDGRYAVDPAGAAVVREIFEMYAKGMNIAKIIAALNARGLRTSTGAPFRPNSLHSILNNERYIGVYSWRDVRVEGGVPQIIPNELFEEVHTKMKKVARAPASARTEVDFLLTGKIFCGHCGSPMAGDSGTGKSGKRFYYYTCVKRKREKSCDKKRVNKDWIEEYVVRLTRDRCLNSDAIQKIVDASMKMMERERETDILRGLKADLAETNRSLSNIMKAIEQGIITVSTKQRLEELENRRAELENAITNETIQQPHFTREQLSFWLNKFRTGDPADPKYREDFIDVFVSAVYVYDDHLRIVCNFTGDDSKVNFEFVDNIESNEYAVDVFDFDASKSTTK